MSIDSRFVGDPRVNIRQLAGRARAQPTLDSTQNDDDDHRGPPPTIIEGAEPAATPKATATEPRTERTNADKWSSSVDDDNPEFSFVASFSNVQNVTTSDRNVARTIPFIKLVRRCRPVDHSGLRNS
jgi:hypothetical protein